MHLTLSIMIFIPMHFPITNLDVRVQKRDSVPDYYGIYCYYFQKILEQYVYYENE